MGGATSKFASEEELQEIKAVSGFSDKQLKSIANTFGKVIKEGEVTISRADFVNLPELATNALVDRLFTVFDKDRDESLSFMEFVLALSVFRPSTNLETKSLYAFRIFDVDNDGLVTHDDLVSAWKQIKGCGVVCDEDIAQLATRLLAMADLDCDGGLNKDEFDAILPKVWELRGIADEM